MGGLCPSRIATSASVEVAADADTLWSLLSDLEESAAAISAVRDFAYLDRASSKSRFQVGTVVRETRVYQGDACVCRRQIVAISDPPQERQADASPAEQQQQYTPRSVSFSTSLDKAAHMSNEFSNTSTLTVVPLTPDSCELVGTYAMKSSGVVVRVWFCWWRLKNMSTDDYFVQELEDLAAAAAEKKKMADDADTDAAASNTR